MSENPHPLEVSPEVVNALWERLQGIPDDDGGSRALEQLDDDSYECLLDGNSDKSLLTSKWDG